MSEAIPLGHVPESERVGLAHAALHAALGHPGVAGSTTGPLGAHVTGTGSQRLPGVLVIAGSDGRYEVTLWLIGRPVDLVALADGVREGVRRATAEAGLLPALGPIDIRWTDLATDLPGEA